MNTRKLWAVLLIAFFSAAMAGCGGSGNPVPDIDESNQDGDIDGSVDGSADDDKLPAVIQLVPPESEDTFIAHIKTNLIERNTSNGGDYGDPVSIDDVSMDSDAGMADGAQESANDSDSTFEGDYSQTNLLVAGVDEGDIAKTDGNYLYTVLEEQQYYYIDDGMLEMDAVIMPIQERESTTTIMITQLDPQTPSSTSVAKVKLENRTDTSIYLYDGEDKNLLADKVVAVSNQAGSGYNYDYWYSPRYWQSGQTKIEIIDVTTPREPALEKSIKIDGSLVQSRRIGNTLYLVTRYTPHLDDIIVYPADDDEVEQNRQKIEAASADELMPKWDNGEGVVKNVVEAVNCFVPSSEDKNNGYSATITTITAIDLTDPDTQTSVCYAGNSDAYYVSTTAMYITQSVYQYQWDNPWVEDLSDEALRYNGDYTVVHKFALTEQGPQYRATGAVPGRLGWRNPQFRMGEKNGLFGMVTSLRNYQTGDYKHKLYILGEASEEDASGYGLDIFAQLPNRSYPERIGKPGEDIYAARFVGDRLYVVTFEQIDPLYVISLDDMEKPYIAGELEMPGYSSYLHALSDSVLVGLGRDTRINSYGATSEEGIKLTLFDVSDPADPSIIKNLTIGERRTNSAALYDHHAFTFLKGTDERPHRIAFPVNLYKYVDMEVKPVERPGEPIFCTQVVGNDDCNFIQPVVDETDLCLDSDGCIMPLPDRYTSPRWIESGLYLFEATDFSYEEGADIRQVGSIIVESASENKNYPSYPRIQRGFIQGDAVHFAWDEEVVSKPWPEPFIQPEYILESLDFYRYGGGELDFEVTVNGAGFDILVKSYQFRDMSYPISLTEADGEAWQIMKSIFNDEITYETRDDDAPTGTWLYITLNKVDETEEYYEDVSGPEQLRTLESFVTGKLDLLED